MVSEKWLKTSHTTFWRWQWQQWHYKTHTQPHRSESSHCFGSKVENHMWKCSQSWHNVTVTQTLQITKPPKDMGFWPNTYSHNWFHMDKLNCFGVNWVKISCWNKLNLDYFKWAEGSSCGCTNTSGCIEAENSNQLCCFPSEFHQVMCLSHFHPVLSLLLKGWEGNKHSVWGSFNSCVKSQWIHPIFIYKLQRPQK